MNFLVTVGLEIHVQLKTKSKMFSSSPNGFSRSPNTEASPFDMAFPGTMPSPNKQAVIYAIQIVDALHMEIDHLLRFDRKNYFYPDLPKGYQITQFFHPIGRNGYLDIGVGHGETRRIGIERAHLEEDTCKQNHYEDFTLLDYNRAGVPLLEIVSRPDFHNGTEAMRYVEAIRNIVVYCKASDGKMEEGSLRCDVNVSLRPDGSDSLGTKVEIKNINSIKNIETAIDYEIVRQRKILLDGGEILPETRRFVDQNGSTTPMRVKSGLVDYKYFPESNIVPVELSEKFVAMALASRPELYEKKKQRYLALGLSETDASIILSDIDVSSYFEECLGLDIDAKEVVSILNGEVKAYLNKNKIGITEFPLPPSFLGSLAKLKRDGYTHCQLVEILDYGLVHPGISALDALRELRIERQSGDESLIRSIVDEVLSANPESVIAYRSGKDRVLGYLVGQVMKRSNGTLKPASVFKIMSEEINEVGK